MTPAPRALILSGGPGYSDPWHPFEESSAALAELLRGAGHRVEISSAVAERLAALDDVDLLVVNAPPAESPVHPGFSPRARRTCARSWNRAAPCSPFMSA